jgi:hypothetical protein
MKIYGGAFPVCSRSPAFSAAGSPATLGRGHRGSDIFAAERRRDGGVPDVAPGTNGERAHRHPVSEGRSEICHFRFKRYGRKRPEVMLSVGTGTGRTWAASRNLQIGLVKVVTHTQYGPAGDLGGRIREAVTEIESGRVPALAEPLVGLNRLPPVHCVEREIDDAELGEKPHQKPAWIAAEGHQQHHCGLGKGRCPNRSVPCRGKPLNQLVVPRLTKEDGDNGGRVDDYTPSGPYPSSASSSLLLSFLPRALAGTVGPISRSRNRMRSA